MVKKDYDALAYDWCVRGQELAKLEQSLDRVKDDVSLALQALEKDKPHVAVWTLQVLLANLEK